MQFRDATEQDLDSVAQFPQSAEELFYLFPRATFPLTKAQLLDNFLTREGNTVVEMDSEIVGFANFISVVKNMEAKIGNVIIKPSARHKGIGKALIDYLCAMASERYGVKKVSISCFSGNTQGLLLYHKLGFTPVAMEERINHLGKRTALFHLEKIISK